MSLITNFYAIQISIWKLSLNSYTKQDDCQINRLKAFMSTSRNIAPNKESGIASDLLDKLPVIRFSSSICLNHPIICLCVRFHIFCYPKTIMYVRQTLNNWSISCPQMLSKQQKEVTKINENLLHIPCSQMLQKLFPVSHKWPK